MEKAKIDLMVRELNDWIPECGSEKKFWIKDAKDCVDELRNNNVVGIVKMKRVDRVIESEINRGNRLKELLDIAMDSRLSEKEKVDVIISKYGMENTKSMLRYKLERIDAENKIAYYTGMIKSNQSILDELYKVRGLMNGVEEREITYKEYNEIRRAYRCVVTRNRETAMILEHPIDVFKNIVCRMQLSEESRKVVDMLVESGVDTQISLMYNLNEMFGRNMLKVRNLDDIAINIRLDDNEYEYLGKFADEILEIFGIELKEGQEESNRNNYSKLMRAVTGVSKIVNGSLIKGYADNMGYNIIGLDKLYRICVSDDTEIINRRKTLEVIIYVNGVRTVTCRTQIRINKIGVRK